jgi:TRAP-type mannitol/chloroaromatic compound transport system permease small subunit
MADLICPNCGELGKLKSKTKGNIWIEILLWCCFLIPGLLYSIWRLTSKQTVCQSYENPGMISVDSPRWNEIWTKYHKK